MISHTREYFKHSGGWAQRDHVVSVANVVHTDLMNSAPEVFAAEPHDQIIDIPVEELGRPYPPCRTATFVYVCVGLRAYQPISHYLPDLGTNTGVSEAVLSYVHTVFTACSGENRTTRGRYTQNS